MSGISGCPAKPIKTFKGKKNSGVILKLHRHQMKKQNIILAFIHLINPQLLFRWKTRIDFRIQWQGADQSWSFSPSKSWGCKGIPATSALFLLLPQRKHWNTPLSLPLCLSIHFSTLNTQDCTLNTYNAHIMHTGNVFYLPLTHIDSKYPSLRCTAMLQPC